MEYLRYGLQDDKLVHINDVPKGLACNCLCPHCKTTLIARKGNKKAKHFAHYNRAECNHGTESALHLMAKSILAQSLKVYVPFVPKTEYDFSKRGRVMAFERAVPEEHLSDTVRGDVVLYNGASFLNVELKVTHAVDLKKMTELFNLGIPTVEVDLSDLISDFTTEQIQQRLLAPQYIRLINSPKCKAIYARLILGEWKEVHHNSWGTYVDDCPKSGKRAYFCDYNRKGGPTECHECHCLRARPALGILDDTEKKDMLLCYGYLDAIDFNEIDKIECLKIEENHISSVDLLMKDGQTKRCEAIAKEVLRAAAKTVQPPVQVTPRPRQIRQPSLEELERRRKKEAQRLKNLMQELAEREKQEAARKKQEAEQKYNQGLQDVQNFDFNEPKNRRDHFNQRWCRCTECQGIKLYEEFVFAQHGTGECQACHDAKRKTMPLD